MKYTMELDDIMKNDIKNIFKSNIEKLNEEYLFEYIQSLSFLLDDVHDIDLDIDYKKIEEIYYNSYFLAINSLQLFYSNEYDVKDYLKKSAEALDTLSQLNYFKFDSDELLFDTLLLYSITDYYSRAYIISNQNKNISLPKYKKVIFQFINKDLVNLRINLLDELNSDNCNEQKIIDNLLSGDIDKIDALESMLSYSIFKSLNDVLNFIFLGQDQFIENSLETLEKFGKFALKYDLVEFWWTIDILKIIIKKFYKNSLWYQLKPFNDSDEYNTKLKQYIVNNAYLDNPIIDFWPSQVKAIPKILNCEENLTINMPTSAGKTLVAELIILKYLLDNDFLGRKIVYLSPFRSLSNEIENKFKKSLGSLGVKISEFYGNNELDFYEKNHLNNFDLLIFTPEKFDSILRFDNDFKQNIGLIIIDEGHIIGENNKRGLNFELLLDRLKLTFTNTKMIFISGVLPNMEDFTEWLSHNPENSINSNWKPSKLLVGTIRWVNNNARISYFYKGEERKQKIPFMREIPNKNISLKGRNEPLAATSLKFANEAPTFVFSPTKMQINSLAKTILKLIPKLEENDLNLKLKVNFEDKEIISLRETIFEELGSESLLLKCLDNGFLIHHGDVPDIIRIKMESILRNNKINLIIGTNTIAQGVNFPLKTVLVKSIYRYSNLIDEQTILNLCGRAGRANEENEGRILLVCDNNTNNFPRKKRNFKKLVYGNSSLNSVFHNILYNIKQIHKEKYPDLSFEMFCLFLAENMGSFNKNFKDLMELINCLDVQLMSLIEENKELDSVELVDLFLKLSLNHVQFPNEENELKIFINSRNNYLKQKYSANFRRKMYKMGLSIPCCEIIEKYHIKLNEMYGWMKNWFDFSEEQKVDFLFNISIFFFNKKIFQAQYDDNRFNNFDDKILRLWLEGFSISQISKELGYMKLKDISYIVKSFNKTFPWLISSTIVFLNDYNEENNLKALPLECQFIPLMFKYRQFDLIMAVLLSEYNDLDLCKQLYGLIVFDDAYTLSDLFTDIYNIKFFGIDKLMFDENNPLIPKDNSNDSEMKIKISNKLINNSILKDNDLVFIKSEQDELCIYDLGGILISKINDKNIIQEFNLNITDINTFWKVKVLDGAILFF